MGERQKVINTGSIPQCPYCEKPTKRTGGSGATTSVYYAPVYDENGNNINPDRNIRTSRWMCMGCNKWYYTEGNNTDGFYYMI